MRMTASWSGPYRPTEYKFAARGSAPESGPPSDRHPDHNEHAAVLGAIKARPGNDGVRRYGGAMAGLDSPKHGGTLNVVGMTIRGELAFRTRIIAPQTCIR